MRSPGRAPSGAGRGTCPCRTVYGTAEGIVLLGVTASRSRMAQLGRMLVEWTSPGCARKGLPREYGSRVWQFSPLGTVMWSRVDANEGVYGVPSNGPALLAANQGPPDAQSDAGRQTVIMLMVA